MALATTLVPPLATTLVAALRSALVPPTGPASPAALGSALVSASLAALTPTSGTPLIAAALVVRAATTRRAVLRTRTAALPAARRLVPALGRSATTFFAVSVVRPRATFWIRLVSHGRCLPGIHGACTPEFASRASELVGRMRSIPRSRPPRRKDVVVGRRLRADAGAFRRPLLGA